VAVKIVVAGVIRGENCRKRTIPAFSGATLVPVNLALLPAVTTLDTEGAAIAAAKERWLRACGDGTSSAVVQGLYEAYRELVIDQVAGIAAPGGRVSSLA